MLTTDNQVSYTFDSGGEHWVYRFPNNYGASVIRTIFSYGNSKGLYELAVIKWQSLDMDAWNIEYTTPITDDVIGSCTADDIGKLLNQIKELKMSLKHNALNT